jgi:6,7-dimethyl-8-ribityllumazine synthase
VAYRVPVISHKATLVPRVFEGKLNTPDGSLAIVVSRYNESITRNLLTAALETLAENGVKDSAIDVAWVPGAWEIPLVADRLAQSGRYVAVICLGAVIRGETTHDQHINRAVSVGLGQAGLRSGVPVLFGVLTCDTLEQAIHRSGGNVGNKGKECATAALEMVDLLARLAEQSLK